MRFLPLPATALAWETPFRLRVWSSDSSWVIEIPAGSVHPMPWSQPAVSFSPDRRFSIGEWDWSTLRLWDHELDMDVGARAIRALKGGDVRIVRHPFWLATERGAWLCFGVWWADRALRKPSAQDTLVCEVVVYDVAADEVVIRIPGGLVGPGSGRRGVFVRHRGRLEYRALAGS
jgi:hypothetical protein